MSANKTVNEYLYDLQCVRLANELDITPAQVATVSRLERDHERATEPDPMATTWWQRPDFEVEIKGGTVHVGYVDSECGWWRCEVKTDGSVEYERF